MTDARSQTPTNTNHLSPIQFRFQLKRAPTLNFNVQQANIPGFNVPSVEIANPFVSYPLPGDHIQYDLLGVNFIVNEDLTDYLEIWNWMRRYAYPNSYSEYSELTGPTVPMGEGIRSDISLIIINSSRLPRIQLTFKDAFPISISSLQFSTTETNVNYLTADASFRFSSYDIELINS